MILQDFPLLDVRKPRILKDLAGWLTQLAGLAVWLWRSEVSHLTNDKKGHRTSNTDRFSVRFRTGLPGSFLCWSAELAGSLGLSHG